MSASVKIDSPKARAVKPPSAASSIKKMISFMTYRLKGAFQITQSFRDSLFIGKDALNYQLSTINVLRITDHLKLARLPAHSLLPSSLYLLSR